MLKKIFKPTILLLIAAVMLFSSVGCSKDKYVPVGMKEISSDIIDYKIYIPTEWTADLSTGVVSAYYSDTDHSSINVTAFQIDSADTTVSDFWESYEETLAQTITDIEYISKAETMLWDSKSAQKYVYTGKLAGSEYKFMQVLMITYGTVYIFTYTSTTELYDSHIEDVNKIIENMSFEH